MGGQSTHLEKNGINEPILHTKISFLYHLQFMLTRKKSLKCERGKRKNRRVSWRQEIPRERAVQVQNGGGGLFTKLRQAEMEIEGRERRGREGFGVVVSSGVSSVASQDQRGESSLGR